MIYCPTYGADESINIEDMNKNAKELAHLPCHQIPESPKTKNAADIRLGYK